MDWDFDIDWGAGLRKVGEYSTIAFDWMKDNPEATAAIAGAAGAGLAYMSEQDRIKAEERMLEKKMAQDDRFKERRPSSGNENYGSHLAGFSGGTGLLKRGQLASKAY